MSIAQIIFFPVELLITFIETVFATIGDLLAFL